MRLRLREMHDAITTADLVRLAVLPRESGAGEDEEDLFLGSMHMGGRRHLAGNLADAAHADVARSGGAPEIGPLAA